MTFLREAIQQECVILDNVQKGGGGGVQDKSKSFNLVFISLIGM